MLVHVLIVHLHYCNVEIYHISKGSESVLFQDAGNNLLYRSYSQAFRIFGLLTAVAPGLQLSSARVEFLYNSL